MSSGYQNKVQASPVQNFAPVGTGLLQRQSALCNTPGLVGERSERDEKGLILQRSPVNQTEPSAVQPIVHEVLSSPGQPLYPKTRAFLEPRFGHDFSKVRVHTGVKKMIQTKLTFNQPNDRYEQEADRVAEQVKQMPEPGVHRQLEEEKEEILQTKEMHGQTSEVTTGIESRINAMRGSGQPLPEFVRAFFEPRFGFDFSHVRIHAAIQAAETARVMKAQAFTRGHHIIFDAGEYAPETSKGRELLAHELTHVVQQGLNGKGGSGLQLGWSQLTDVQRKPSGEWQIIATTEPIEEGGPMPGPEITWPPPGPITSTWLHSRSRQWLVDEQEFLRDEIENIFELITRDWTVPSATAGGSGVVSFRVSDTGVAELSDCFARYLAVALRGRTVPEDLEIDPDTVLAEEVLPFIVVTLEVSNQPATPVVRLTGGCEEFALSGFDALDTPIDLLRAGGPVELTAQISLQNGVSIGTIARDFYVTPRSLDQTRIERVLQYREIVEEISSARGIDPSIVMAIISMETQGIAAGRPGEELRSGYFGLMQARFIGIRLRHTSGRRESYPTREAFEEAVSAYRANIRQQIEDGIAVFLDVVRALRLPSPATSLTDDEIELALAAYGAGIGTLQAARESAEQEGGEWSEFRFMMPALAETGAYDVVHLFPMVSREWNREEFRLRLQGCCDEEVSEEATREVMRSRMITCLEQQRSELRGRSNITLPQLQSRRFACLGMVIERKASNTAPSRAYFRQWFSYRRFYQSLQ